MKTTTTPTSPDLTQRPPRSLRCRLGGYAVLPRLLDKCRASLAGTLGEYHSDCPLDRHFLSFTGTSYQALRGELAEGRSDSEMLAWVNENSATLRTPWEIEQWSAFQERRMPDSDANTVDFFAGILRALSTIRTDIHTWADLLDLDDHCSFGGQA